MKGMSYEVTTDFLFSISFFIIITGMNKYEDCIGRMQGPI